MTYNVLFYPKPFMICVMGSLRPCSTITGQVQHGGSIPRRRQFLEESGEGAFNFGRREGCARPGREDLQALTRFG